MTMITADIPFHFLQNYFSFTGQMHPMMLMVKMTKPHNATTPKTSNLHLGCSSWTFSAWTSQMRKSKWCKIRIKNRKMCAQCVCCRWIWRSCLSEQLHCLCIWTMIAKDDQQWWWGPHLHPFHQKSGKVPTFPKTIQGKWSVFFLHPIIFKSSGNCGWSIPEGRAVFHRGCPRSSRPRHLPDPCLGLLAWTQPPRYKGGCLCTSALTKSTQVNITAYSKHITSHGIIKSILDTILSSSWLHCNLAINDRNLIYVLQR